MRRSEKPARFEIPLTFSRAEPHDYPIGKRNTRRVLSLYPNELTCETTRAPLGTGAAAL